jgi:two-component system sensor histidine kinase QseC
VVAVDGAGLDRSLRLLLSALLVVGLALVGAAALVVTRIVGRGLRPLDRLAAEAGRIDGTSLGTRFPGEGLPGELRPICSALDALLQRLDRTFERERRFTADAAHELRTPIAELRSLAEVNLRFPGDARASARAFRETVEIAGQMEGLVAALLHLARSDAGALRPARAPVELAEAVREAWRDLEETAREKRLEVSWRCDDVAEAFTDRALARAILGNLLANAVEYAPPGGSVEVRLEPVAGGVVATIGNTNDTLVADDLPHLFERFWRKDGARRPSGHAGLGLAVVEALARLLDVDVRAELPAPSWFRVRLRFPGTPGAALAHSAAVGTDRPAD